MAKYLKFNTPAIKQTTDLKSDFISGHTSKIAGTEIGLGIEPRITFSACFGAPWGDKDEYWKKYDALAARYIENFKQFADGCPPEVAAAGPTRLGEGT